MVDHSWLISAMRDIRDYAVMNRLDHLVPVVKAACAAVEQGLDRSGKEQCGLEISASEADGELVAAFCDALCLEEKHFLSLSNLKPLSEGPDR